MIMLGWAPGFRNRRLHNIVFVQVVLRSMVHVNMLSIHFYAASVGRHLFVFCCLMYENLYFRRCVFYQFLFMSKYIIERVCVILIRLCPTTFFNILLSPACRSMPVSFRGWSRTRVIHVLKGPLPEHTYDKIF